MQPGGIVLIECHSNILHEAHCFTGLQMTLLLSVPRPIVNTSMHTAGWSQTQHRVSDAAAEHLLVAKSVYYADVTGLDSMLDELVSVMCSPHLCALHGR